MPPEAGHIRIGLSAGSIPAGEASGTGFAAIESKKPEAVYPLRTTPMGGMGPRIILELAEKRKTMKLVGTILALALLCGIAQAADKNTRFQVIGAGVMTCQAYLDANDEDRKLAEMWWTGYVTATNGLTDDTWSVVGRDPNARVNDAVEKQCKEHPKAMFVIAVHEAIQSLYKDNRIESAPAN